MSRESKMEAPQYAAFAARIMRAMSRRAGAGDLDSLAHLMRLRDDLDAAIDDAARIAHGDLPGGPAVPFSWTEIAAAIGVSRQYALKRFGTAYIAAAVSNGGQPIPARNGLRRSA